MKRPIIRFGHDDIGDWVATLNCGHLQHVRHSPPFINRPWVITEFGRKSKIGETLNCVRCDKFEFPENFIPYKKTPVFTEESLPSGLKNDHSTKTGVWGKIILIEGTLQYRVNSLKTDTVLFPNEPGIILPEILHSVALLGPVKFYVEFYKEPDYLA
jgi:tellurite methyltransferase|tara:strand:- start:332 stop:802 length:471 start_codon:yes stop_codon:yes gene_type:complete